MLLVLLEMLLVLLELLLLMFQVRHLAQQLCFLHQRCCCSALGIVSALLGRLVARLETSNTLQTKNVRVSEDRKLHRHGR